VSLAYFIKGRLGYGSVIKVKDKNAFILVITATEGLKKVINLINGKIKTFNTFDQMFDMYDYHNPYTELRKIMKLDLNLNKDFKNHWLAGFSDANASFQIKILNQLEKREVRLNCQIDHENNDILLLIKEFLGGNIGFIKNQNTYSYKSTSFGSAKIVINYFDHFHLLSIKQTNYLK
jgi:uncharacterized protein YeaO (DUF488 family)